LALLQTDRALAVRVDDAHSGQQLRVAVEKSGVFTRKLAMSSSVIGVIGLFIGLSPSRR
jgi:hypothetical protein